MTLAEVGAATDAVEPALAIVLSKENIRVTSVADQTNERDFLEKLGGNQLFTDVLWS